MTFMYECDRLSTDQGSELLKDSVSFHLYHSMFIAHDEWQDLIAQTIIRNHNTEEYESILFSLEVGKINVHAQTVCTSLFLPQF